MVDVARHTQRSQTLASSRSGVLGFVLDFFRARPNRQEPTFLSLEDVACAFLQGIAASNAFS